MLKLTVRALLITLTAVGTAQADTLVATFYYAEGDFEFTDEEGGGDTFDFIELPDELHFMNPGEPMMPLVTAAFLSRLDLLIGPDSSLVHFAGAFEVPTVALYGPFPGAVRTKYYPRCVTLEGRYAVRPGLEECAPCFKHGPYPCPRAGEDRASPCLRNLEPEAVIRAALGLLAKNGRRSGGGTQHPKTPKEKDIIYLTR